MAIHLAAQALLAGDCDMALAGGVTLHVLRRNPDIALADAAWTLQVGRQEQRYRRFVVAE